MSDVCDYCGDPAVRHDPFGARPCCHACFNIIIGGDANDPPWRCGADPTDGAE